MLPILTFLSTLWGRGAVVAAAILALVALRAADIRHQRAIGEVRAVAKIEKANDNATKLGKRAADRSAAGGVRGGPVDPSSRDD